MSFSRQYLRLRERCDGFHEPDDRCPSSSDCVCYAVRKQEEPKVFLKLLAVASKKQWRLEKVEAFDLAVLALKVGALDPGIPRGVEKLVDKLQYGQVMMRGDGVWACTTCGSNCGQCGDTGFYGNIGGPSLDHIAKTSAGRVNLPVYRFPRSWNEPATRTFMGLAFVALCLGVAILLGVGLP